VELTVCQKNVADALNSVVIILKNKVQFVTFPFFFMVELQNFLNAPRIKLNQSELEFGAKRRLRRNKQTVVGYLLAYCRRNLVKMADVQPGDQASGGIVLCFFWEVSV